MAPPAGTPIICPVLVGRAPQLEALGRRLEQVRDGRGQVLLVSGEAGFADDLVWLCRQLGVEKPVVVGHSMGGNVRVDKRRGQALLRRGRSWEADPAHRRMAVDHALVAEAGARARRDAPGGCDGPALVLSGRHSRIFPWQSSAYLAERRPDARLVMFEESGHCPFYEEPEKFNAAVAAFVG